MNVDKIINAFTKNFFVNVVNVYHIYDLYIAHRAVIFAIAQLSC